MPPAQCPECGRFLKAALVAALPEGPAPCPGCGTELREEQFTGRPAPAPTARDGGAESVRPPDLAPESVRDEASDVLAGWDVDAGPDDVAAWRRDRAPFPLDAVVLAGAATAGLLLGVTVDRDRRLRGALAGAVGGALAAAIARRLWRLDA